MIVKANLRHRRCPGICDSGTRCQDAEDPGQETADGVCCCLGCGCLPHLQLPAECVPHEEWWLSILASSFLRCWHFMIDSAAFDAWDTTMDRKKYLDETLECSFVHNHIAMKKASNFGLILAVYTLLPLCPSYRQCLMLILPPSTPILPRRLMVPPHPILINTQSLQSHRPSRMYLIRTNPHLRPKSKPRPIRKPRARIPKHARAVHPTHEPFREVF